MERTEKIILAVISVILILTIGTSVYAAANRLSPKGVFTPPPFDEGAIDGAPANVDESLLYRSLAIKEGFSVAICGNPVIGSDGRVTVYFTAAKTNTVYVRLLVLNENGEQLGATGLLKPNEYVKTVVLDQAVEAGTAVMFKFLSYEPDTYYSMGSAAATVVLGAGEEKVS